MSTSSNPDPKLEADPSPEPAKITLKGSCHCQFIRYTISIPPSVLSTATAGRCNCTVCLKQGFTPLRFPKSDFHLISPASLSECKDYRVNPDRDIHKYFCGNCGIHVVGEGKFAWKDGFVDFFQINLGTLDQPQEGLELSKWKISYVNGRDNRWEDRKETPFRGGLL